MAANVQVERLKPALSEGNQRNTRKALKTGNTVRFAFGLQSAPTGLL